MSNIKVLSLALLAAATLASPALARDHVATARHVQTDADNDAGAVPQPVYGATTCVSAPRVGAFASEPWTNGNVPCEPGTVR